MDVANKNSKKMWSTWVNFGLKKSNSNEDYCALDLACDDIFRIVKLVVLLLIHCMYVECLLNNAGVNILLANLHDCQLNMKGFSFGMSWI